MYFSDQGLSSLSYFLPTSRSGVNGAFSIDIIRDGDMLFAYSCVLFMLMTSFLDFGMMASIKTNPEA